MPDYSDTRIQLRRGSAAEWASANTVLGEGEPGFSVNNNTLKIGDGVTTYANLSGISGGGGGGGISNVVEDTNPQLGGDLDANGNDIDMGTNVITDAKVGYWVPSNTSAVSNSTQVTNLVMITQSNYDALGSYDANTLYFII